MTSPRTRTIVVTGAGGVGKTTLSAAMAIVAADEGARSLVLTVDPARRLADALGVGPLGNEPVEVSGHPGLWAAMLDVTASWESVIHHYAEPDVADRLLENPFFRAIADRFPAAQAFAASEEMAQLIESGVWDVLIVDTPPSGGGIDFFLAPRRTGDLVGGKLLLWLTGARLPARRALYRITARPMLRLADTVLGGPLLEEIAEFLLDLRTMYDGLRTRARTIERHLRRAATIVVTTSDPTPLREARRFFEELTDVEVIPELVLFNRALPAEWVTAADRPIRGVPDAELRSVLKMNLRRWGAEAARQQAARREFSNRYRVDPATVPWLPTPPATMAELGALVRQSARLVDLVRRGI